MSLNASETLTPPGQTTAPETSQQKSRQPNEFAEPDYQTRMSQETMKLFDLSLNSMKSWHLSPLKEYSGTGMSWVKSGPRGPAPRVEISGEHRFPFTFDVGKDKQIVKGQMNRLSGIMSISAEEAEKLGVFDEFADWAHDTNKGEWWGHAYPRRGYQLNEVVKRSFRKDRESNDPKNPYKLGEDGRPIEDMSVRFKVAHHFPSDTRFRLAGVWDEDTGRVVEESAFQRTINRRTMTAVEGSEREVMVSPPAWNETRFFVVDKDSGNTYDKTVAADSKGNNLECSKTGRAVYRYFGPEDVTSGSTITKLVLEVNALYFSNGTGRGVSFKAREVHFTPRAAPAAAAGGGGGDQKYDPSSYGAAAPPPPSDAMKISRTIAAGQNRDDEDEEDGINDDDFEAGDGAAAAAPAPAPAARVTGAKRGRGKPAASSGAKRGRGRASPPAVTAEIPDEDALE